jgi:hypothetical protein
MELKELITQIKQKESFQKFITENPSAYLAAVFVVLDDTEKDSYQLDFFIPENNKIAISAYPFEKIIIQEDEIKQAQRLDANLSVDINNLREKVNEVKNKNNMEKIKISKTIGILKDDEWRLTCLSLTLDIIKINLNKEGLSTKCEKASLIDFVVKKK